jgi:hypothetical protein
MWAAAFVWWLKWTPILGPEAKLERPLRLIDGGHDDEEDETED